MRERIQAHAARREHFETSRIVRWMCELTSALQYVHRKRVLHRDLKTANILLTSDDQVTVTSGDGDLSIVTCDL